MEFMSLKVIGIKVTFKVVLVVGRLAPFINVKLQKKEDARNYSYITGHIIAYFTDNFMKISNQTFQQRFGQVHRRWL